MPSVYLLKYLEEKDSFGVKVGEWAKQEDPGYAICKICVPRARIGFKSGLHELTLHSENKKHRAAWENRNKKSQNSLLDLIHQSAQRNRLHHNTLKAHLNIKSGLENIRPSNSEEKKHCHCKDFEITKTIRDQCLKSHQVVRSNVKKQTEEKKKELTQKKEDSEKKRLRGFRNSEKKSPKGRRSGVKKCCKLSTIKKKRTRQKKKKFRKERTTTIMSRHLR